ncbi:MAG: zinc ABC transporter solute-binding protein [Aeromonadales bacterium]|nr:zinc ABC transporter solute-binding protein [Aeromonadales bacterium]
MAKKLSIVTTNFPSYDIASHVAGNKADVIMLLKPGSDMHSYEPSVKDINAIRNADLLYYTGGENDTWSESLLESFDKSIDTLQMIDCVNTLDEEQKKV